MDIICKHVTGCPFDSFLFCDHFLTGSIFNCWLLANGKWATFQTRTVPHYHVHHFGISNLSGIGTYIKVLNKICHTIDHKIVCKVFDFKKLVINIQISFGGLCLKIFTYYTKHIKIFSLKFFYNKTSGVIKFFSVTFNRSY